MDKFRLCDYKEVNCHRPLMAQARFDDYYKKGVKGHGSS